MADVNSVFYKIGQAVKQQVSTGTADLTNKANKLNSQLSGLTSAENINVSEDLTVSGNLKVLGEQTVTKISQEDLQIKDNLISLNRGASTGASNTKDIGLYFERGSSQAAGAFLFDEANDQFVVGYLEGNSSSAIEVSQTNSSFGAFTGASLAFKIGFESGSFLDQALNYGDIVTYAQGDMNVVGVDYNANTVATTMLQIEISDSSLNIITLAEWLALDEAGKGSSSINVYVSVGTEQLASTWLASDALEVQFLDNSSNPDNSSEAVAEAAKFSLPASSKSITGTGIDQTALDSNNLSGFSGDFSADALNTLTLGNISSAAADDEDANAAATSAAKLKVASLEITDAEDGAVSLGDLSDFEAGLVA